MGEGRREMGGGKEGDGGRDREGRKGGKEMGSMQ